MDFPAVSITVSGSDAAIRFARLSGSMKVKPPDFAPLLTPVGTVPTIPTTSSSSPHSLLACRYSGTILLALFSSSTISKSGFGYNGGFYGADVASLILEAVCAKRDLISLDTTLDIIQPTTWLLHGEIIFFFIESSNIFATSLFNLSASNDVSMIFQGHVEERHSSVPHFKILHASICFGIINLNTNHFSPDLINPIPKRGDV